MRLAKMAGLRCVPLTQLIRSMGHGGFELLWPALEVAWRWPRRKVSSTPSLRPRVQSGPVLGSGYVNSSLSKIADLSEFGLQKRGGVEERRFRSCSHAIPGRQLLLRKPLN